MSDDIPFDKSFDLAPGAVEEVRAGRPAHPVQQSEPVHLQGDGQLHRRARPGRDHRSGPDRRGARRGAARRRARRDRDAHHRHPHPSRSFAAAPRASRLRPARKTYGEGPHRPARPLNIGEAPRHESGGDLDFRPDVALADGDVVDGDGWALEAVATPGHTANHMAFALKGTDVLFSGDHVMAWSTPVVAPPDGAMSDYMASLDKLAAPRRDDLFPRSRRRGDGCAALRRSLHPASQGARGSDPAPARQGREPTSRRWCGRSISGSIRGSTRAAGLSVLAHLEDLVARGLVATEGAPSIDGRYRLAGLSGLAPCGGLALLWQRRDRRAPASWLPTASSMSSSRRADARGIAAEIEGAVARRRAHVDARAVAVRRAPAPPRRRGSP